MLGVVNKQELVLQRASLGTEICGEGVKTEAALCVAGAPPKSRSTQDGSVALSKFASALSKFASAPSIAGGATNTSKSNSSVKAGHAQRNYNNFLNIIYRRFFINYKVFQRDGDTIQVLFIYVNMDDVVKGTIVVILFF